MMMTHNSCSESYLIQMNKWLLMIFKWFWSEGDADCAKKTQSAHALPYPIKGNMFAYSTPLSMALDLKELCSKGLKSGCFFRSPPCQEITLWRMLYKMQQPEGCVDVLHECLFVREAELTASHPIGGTAMQHASAHSRNKRDLVGICSSQWPMDPPRISIAEQGMMRALECWSQAQTTTNPPTPQTLHHRFFCCCCCLHSNWD